MPGDATATLGVQRWISAYLAARRDRLADHRRSDLPLLRGFDVRLVQLALSQPDIGKATQSDRVFGPMTERCVRRFQRLGRQPKTGTLTNEEVARLLV